MEVIVKFFIIWNALVKSRNRLKLPDAQSLSYA